MMFNSNRAIFESNDEIDFQAQKFGGVVLTALTIAEQMTGLTFHKVDVIAFLNVALAEPQDDTEEGLILLNAWTPANKGWVHCVLPVTANFFQNLCQHKNK